MLTILALYGVLSNVTAQNFYNLDFSQTSDSTRTGLGYWALSWDGNKTSCRPDNGALLIESTVPRAVGFAEQTAAVTAPTELKIISLSGKIKAEGIEGKGAGFNIAVYDADGGLLFNRDMGYASLSWVTGTRDWKEYHLGAICPPEAATIKLGVILYGKGKAWFDDFKVNIVSAKDRKPSKLAKAYINAACDTIARHSLHKDSVDLEKLRSTALQIAGPAKKTSDCHLGVVYLLQALGDHHSFFMAPEEVKDWRSGANAGEVEYAQFRVTDGCGYISVPHFDGDDTDLKIAFADTIQQAIRLLSKQGIQGWIIDLRNNTGGNMEPMIAGLGPLFDTQMLGYLVDVEGGRESWSYRNGAYFWEEEKKFEVSQPIVLRKRLPIAVLISSRTGSSGEIVVISFIGNGNTRLFGQPTWGLTTGNGDFDLSDGAKMFLASTVMADRSGRTYEGRVDPDVLVDPNKDPYEDADLKAAIQWIKNK